MIKREDEIINPGTILLVDDDPYIILSLKTLLEPHYKNILTLGNPEEIPSLLRKTTVDLVLLDMNFKPGDTSGREGLRYLKKIMDMNHDACVIMITAYGGIHVAVKAMKAGAFDFVIKPWQNEKVVSTVSAAFRLIDSRKNLNILKSQKEVLSQTLDARYTNMLGTSPQMKKVFSDIEKVAVTEANVLILGENGTGKEMVARALHRQSNRSRSVFISVDLGALSENLFESELFGHIKGAFTDAKENRVGRFEAASGGTLFLDEIGNLPPALQSKLLRALEERKIYRVGSNIPVEVDIRLISATNQNLKTLVSSNNFREDLLYRINTVEIQLPALRDRSGDINLLTDFFLELYTKKYRKPGLFINPKARKRIESQSWPGNVRELQHAIERAVILCESSELKDIDFDFLRRGGQEEEKPGDFHLDSLEQWAVGQCLQKHNGNVSKAAAELGLTRGALYRRINKYGL